MSKNISEKSNFVIENEILVEYTGNSNAVQIPENVKKIGAGAFEGSNIEEISFEKATLQSIEDRAFKGCKKLEFLELPDGIVKIGKEAFYGCSSLKCAVIPSSIVVLEASAFDLCSSDFYIIGAKKSEAEVLATEKHFGFRLNNTEAIDAYKSASKKRKELITKTFNVFGEEVTCSNSLPLYHRIIKNYKNIADKFIEDVVNYLPKDVDKKANGDLGKIVQGAVTQATRSLEKEGVVVDSDHALVKILPDFQALGKEIELTFKILGLIKEQISQNIEGKVVDLKHEINSQVRGLSYGVIGNTVDLLIHDIGEAEAKAEQRARATAIAESKLASYKKEQWSEGSRIYKEELQKHLTVIREHAKKIINCVMQWELDMLASSGMLDLNAMESLDCDKSMEILKSSQKRKKDERVLLALAIQKYPYNISAIGRAVSKKYTSEALTELIAFLGISKEVEECAKKERESYISDLKKEISSEDSLSSALKRYSGIRQDLDVGERKLILECITKINTDKVHELLSPSNLANIEDIQAFVEERMSLIIDAKQWDYLIEEGATPIKSTKIPADKIEQRDTLVQYIISTRSEAQDEKNLKLSSANLKLQSAKTINDFEEARRMFLALSGYGNSSKAIVQIDETIRNLKCEAISSELGKSKSRKKLKKARADLAKLGNHLPSANKIVEIEALLKKDIVKKIILCLCATILLAAIILVSYFVIYPNSLKNSGNFNDYITYIEKFDVEHFEIPDGTTTIPENAFKDCKQLRSITIPSSVTEIGEGAFSGCSNLTNVYISDLKAYCEISFASESSNPLRQATYLYYNGSIVTDLVVPEGTTKIGDYAFCYYDNLRSVTIPDSVKSIGKTAFREIDNLTTVNLGKNVESIGEYAFIHCKKISSISIPESLKNIGDSAFSCCDGIKKVYITDIEKWFQLNLNSEIAGDKPYNSDVNTYALYLNNVELENLIIPSNISNVGYALRGCQSIKKLTIHEGVASIQEGALMGCDNLVELTIPFIGANAASTKVEGHLGYIFGYKEWKDMYSPLGHYYEGRGNHSYDCYEYYIPAALTTVKVTNASTINSTAFLRCSYLKKIEICQGTTSIDGNAFDGCTNLETLLLPDSIHNIGTNMFSTLSKLNLTEYDNAYYCGNSSNPFLILVQAKNKEITSCNINERTKFISAKAFAGCQNLSAILIHKGIKEVGESAFETCSKLSNLIIEDGVKSIGHSAFEACNSIISVEIPDSVTSLGAAAFQDCTALRSVKIGCGITSIGTSTFDGCEKISTLIIPISVTEIGGWAFDFGGRDNLSYVYYGGTSQQWSNIVIDKWGSVSSIFAGEYMRPSPLYYYSETKPTTAGKYWHYVDGVPTIW